MAPIFAYGFSTPFATTIADDAGVCLRMRLTQPQSNNLSNLRQVLKPPSQGQPLPTLTYNRKKILKGVLLESADRT